MHIYSLEEAYDIILNKLDNVDAKKRTKIYKGISKIKGI